MKRSLLAIGAMGLAVWAAIPFDVARLKMFPAGVRVLDADGRVLREFLSPEGFDCIPVYRPRAEDWIVKAIIAAEDSRFQDHCGVDVRSIGRALVQNVWSRKVVSGASTLSTQVIRLVEPRPRNLWTKLREASAAVKMEFACSKQDILAQYLNRAPFGGNLVGIESASWRYFNKSPHDLSLAEASLLAGLPQSPARLRPDRHPHRARMRQSYVLDRMQACGFISDDERRDALTSRLAYKESPRPNNAPHFCDMIAADVAEAGRAEIRTTLDPRLQSLLEACIRRHVESGNERTMAAVVIDVKAFAIRALVGAPDYNSPSPHAQVNGVLAPRSAGSTLKPFVYAAALDRGWITPATALADVPDPGSGRDVENFDGAFQGVVPARDALIQSLNMPAVGLAERLGTEAFHGLLKTLGFSTIRKPATYYGSGLVLGNAEVRLLDLANAYACLARGGIFRAVQWCDVNAHDRTSRVFSEEASWLVADMLAGDERADDAAGHNADVRMPKAAWKTGTSSGFRDAWTIAWNPDFVIGVWSGMPDGGSDPGLVGRVVATPVAWDFIRSLYPDGVAPWYVQPPGLEARDVCSLSGSVPGPFCADHAEAWYVQGVSGSSPCAVHRGSGETWPEAVSSFLAQRNGATDEPGQRAPLRILSPRDGDIFRFDPAREGDDQNLLVQAEAEPTGELHWFVNQRLVGVKPAGARWTLPLQKGRHEIACVRAGGESDRITIRVD